MLDPASIPLLVRPVSDVIDGVAWQDGHYLVVSRDMVNLMYYRRNIVAVRVDTDGDIIDRVPNPVSITTNDEEEGAAVAGSQGRVAFVYHSYSNEPDSIYLPRVSLRFIDAGRQTLRRQKGTTRCRRNGTSSASREQWTSGTTAITASRRSSCPSR